VRNQGETLYVIDGGPLRASSMGRIRPSEGDIHTLAVFQESLSEGLMLL